MSKIYDEILDTSSQPDTNPRYIIRDNNGVVLKDDIQIELKTPILQEGTPINKALFNSLHSYQELAVEKIDHSYSEVITRNINFNINSFSKGDTTLTGQATSTFYDTGEKATMTISTSVTKGWYLNNTESGGYDVINHTATGTATISGINDILNRTTYNDSYRVAFNTGSSTKAYGVRTFIFDFKTQRKVTLKWYSGWTVENFTFYGSNNNSEWTIIDTFTRDEAVSIPSETAYRYYKIENTSVVYSNMYLYYMYFEVEDSQLIPQFENSYTYNGEISELKQILAKIPNQIDMTNVKTNTINGIDVEEILEASSLYTLVCVSNKIKTVNFITI